MTKKEKKSSLRFLLTFIIFAMFFSPYFIPVSEADLDSSEIVFSVEFSCPKIKIEPDLIQISFPETKTMKFQDNVELPVKPLKLLLPKGSTVADIIVETKKPQMISEEPLMLEDKPMESYFEKTKIHYEIIGQYWAKGYPVLYLNLYPVYVDEISQHLFSYTEITVHVLTEYASFNAVTKNNLNDAIKVSSIVDNPQMLQSYEISNSESDDAIAKYVIITNETLVQSPLEDDFQYLMYSKNIQGISTAIFSVEEIINNPDYSVNGSWGDNNPSNPFFRTPITHNYSLFDDTQAKIRNFIRYAYTELGTEYVLLGGDADVNNPDQNIIPARGLFANESGLPLINNVTARMNEEQDDIPSDVYYACLDGNFNEDMDQHFGESPDRNQRSDLDEADLLSEISVGRACVDSYEEIANFVSKTFFYEFMDEDPYLAKMLFLGEYLGFPGISVYGGNYKDEIKYLVPESFNLVTLYDRDLPANWIKQDLIDIINQAPPHIINHDGHAYYGYNLRMSNGDVDRLHNIKPFIVYSHGCMAGGFDNPTGYDCIAERLTVETNSGAVAAIMNARYGLGSENNLESPSLFLDESFFKAVFQEDIRRIGDANHFSKEDNIWRINENGVRWVFYETNLFGDPYLQIRQPPDYSLNLICDVTNPEINGFLYLFNTKILPLPLRDYPVLIGAFDVSVDATSQPNGHVYGVEFYLDDESYYFDDEPPYAWHVKESLSGYHNISVKVHSYYGDTKTSSFSCYAFVNGK